MPEEINARNFESPAARLQLTSVPGELRETVRAALLLTHSERKPRQDFKDTLIRAYSQVAAAAAKTPLKLTDELICQVLPVWVLEGAIELKWTTNPPPHCGTYQYAPIYRNGKVIPSGPAEADPMVRFGSYEIPTSFRDWFLVILEPAMAGLLAAQFSNGASQPKHGDLDAEEAVAASDGDALQRTIDPKSARPTPTETATTLVFPSEEPLGKNPFPTDDHRHKGWAVASRIARQHLTQHNAALLARKPPLGAAMEARRSWWIEFLAGRFACMGVAAAAVFGRTDEAIPGCERLLKHFAEFIFQQGQQIEAAELEEGSLLPGLRLKLLEYGNHIIGQTLQLNTSSGPPRDPQSRLDSRTIESELQSGTSTRASSEQSLAWASDLGTAAGRKAAREGWKRHWTTAQRECTNDDLTLTAFNQKDRSFLNQWENGTTRLKDPGRSGRVNSIEQVLRNNTPPRWYSAAKRPRN